MGHETPSALAHTQANEVLPAEAVAAGKVFPDVPIEETVGAIAELVEAGYVRHLGLPRPRP